MASQTSVAETSGSNLHYTIQVDSVEELLHANQHFVREILDRNWKNEQFLKILDDHFDDTHQTINFYAAVVQEYLSSASNYQSLGQDGEEVSWEAPLNISHHHFFHHLAAVYTQQLRMKDNLQSFQNDLAQKLRRAKAWTRVSAVALMAAVLITSGAAAATTRAPATMAAAAAVPVLLGTIGSWTLSLLRKHKDGVKKHVEITGVMLVGAKITINDLSSLYSSARRFEFLTKAASEMAESADDVGHEVRKKLMESFQELLGQATDFCRDIRLARELTLHSVIKHLDFITN